MSGRRVLVCGGRDYSDRDTLYRVLDAAEHSGGVGVIMQGEAPGADALAREWAESRRIAVEGYPADWVEFGRRAGPARNRQMVAAKPDIVFAFPGGRGTRDMLKQARRAGIVCLTVELSGMISARISSLIQVHEAAR